MTSPNKRQRDAAKRAREQAKKDRRAAKEERKKERQSGREPAAIEIAEPEPRED